MHDHHRSPAHHGHDHEHPRPFAARPQPARRRSGRWRTCPRAPRIRRPPPSATSTWSRPASSRASFATADPTSFLRLAGIPFVGVDGDGRRLHLLRVETESLTDLGAVSPLLNGEGMRYDPLPARMVSQRRRLAFVYHDGRGVVRLDFAEARRLRDESAAARFAVEVDG